MSWFRKKDETIEHSYAQERLSPYLDEELPLEERRQVQVSMNLVNYKLTPIPLVFETVKMLAESHGVAVGNAELVGPVPLDALHDVVAHYLRVRDFNMEQVIETKLID